MKEPEGRLGGRTWSVDLPTTVGAFALFNAGDAGCFVAKLDTAGATLIYSTYLGGSGEECCTGLAVDGNGDVYAGGFIFAPGITSSTFPTTVGAWDTTLGGFHDAFVTKLKPVAGAGLVYSTFLGGSSIDAGYGIAIGNSDKAYVTGRTDSTDFPTTAGAFSTALNGLNDVFVAELDMTGSILLYSTAIGGSMSQQAFGIAVDANGDVYVAGETQSADFPTTVGAFDTT